MNVTIKDRTFTTAMVILATIVVIVLAVLQYRWSNQISEATSTRLADSLQMSMINWHLDLYRDFSEICVAMHEDSEADARSDWSQYARRFSEWRKTTAHPQLVSGIYVLRADHGADTKVLRLNPVKLNFEEASLPGDLSELRNELHETPARPPVANAGTSAQEPGAPSPDSDYTDRLYTDGPSAGWQFDPHLAALVRPIVREQSNASNPNSRDADWMVIALNRKTVQEQVLPELAQRYFRGTDGRLDYQIAVIAGKEPARILYSSDPPFGEKEVADADGTMNIFGHLQDKQRGSPIHIFHAPSENKGPTATVGISWFPLLEQQPEDRDWRLVLRHRRGGALGAFVADSRRRDLAISFGVLLLLVISIAILIVTSTRAQRLAKLQMDFVTAVSHELRTPLTVIGSAAENIAHGVVEGKEQLERYGSVIEGQTRKLTEMVEQILLFASIREGHQRYTLRPLEIADVLDSALYSTTGLIEAGGFRIEQNIESGLPQVMGDPSALSQCLQNLITNALKYGSEQRWIGIKARVIEHGMSGKEVQISVSDRGIGIRSQELPHIFEPFYRSSEVMAAQIPGTGLGLPLAKSIAEAMKGHLTVRSSPGQGSTFTLHLPCPEQPIRQTGTRASEAISS